MKIEQRLWQAGKWKLIGKSQSLKNTAQLVLVFGERYALEKTPYFTDIQKFYPQATIVTGSTAGEIIGNEVYDDSISATAIALEKSNIQLAEVSVKDFPDSRAAGAGLAKLLPHEDLKHVFILSDGTQINGTELISGLNATLPAQVTITGGLAGDGARFEKTLVGCNHLPEPGKIVAIGFYGTAIRAGFGSFAGWEPFGPWRLITKAEKNVLFELDGKPALQLYKEYLGEKAAELPASALLFPLMIRPKAENERAIVRTILGIDEAENSMTFAGDIPVGYYAQLMKANFEKLIEGAATAARTGLQNLNTSDAELAILISCIGRKLVMNQRVADEVEGVANLLQKHAAVTGFYSYGEMAPFTAGENCFLHNQTMTITFLSEN